MILSRFIIHLAVFVAFVAVVIPLIAVVTVPAFQANSAYTNTTCLVVGKQQETQMQCNNTGVPFNGTAYDTATGDFTEGSKQSWLDAHPMLSSQRAYYIPGNTTFLRLWLNYQGWALVLELLFGVCIILAAAGMVISCVLNESTAEPL